MPVFGAVDPAASTERAQLYESGQRRAVQLAVVNEVARRAASILDMDQLLQEVVTAIQQGFNYHTVLVEEPKGQIGPFWLTVRLRNGEEYTGALSNFVWVGDEDNTIELGLEKVTYKPPKATPQAYLSEKGNRSAESGIPVEPIESPSQRVLFRSQDVLWLSRLEVSKEGAIA